jgi:hypothetical protein
MFSFAGIVSWFVASAVLAQPVPQALQTKLTQLVGTNNFTAAFKDRSLAIMEDPGKLSQGGIGICGLTSSLHALLKDKDPDLRARFVSLLEAIFKKQAFQGLDPSTGVTVAPDAQQAGYLLAYQVAQFRAKNRFTTKDIALIVSANEAKWQKEWFISQRTIDERKANLTQELQRTLVAEESLFDFVAARALARLLKLKDLTLYGHQTEHSAHYVEDFNDRNSTKAIARNKGDLAVDFQSMKVILKDILGAHSVSFATAPETEVHTKAQEFWALAQKANQIFAQTAKLPFVLAAVRGWGTLWSSTSPAMDEGSKATKSIVDGSDLLYSHWVVITGPITQNNDHTYSVPAWTWGGAKTLRIRSSVVRSFFHGFLYGTWKS